MQDCEWSGGSVAIADQSVGRAVDAVVVVVERVDAAIGVVLSAAVEVSVGGFAVVVAINATVVVVAGGGFAGAVNVAAAGHAFDGSLGCLVGLHPVHLMTAVFQILPGCHHYLKSNTYWTDHVCHG